MSSHSYHFSRKPHKQQQEMRLLPSLLINTTDARATPSLNFFFHSAHLPFPRFVFSFVLSLSVLLYIPHHQPHCCYSHTSDQHMRPSLGDYPLIPVDSQIVTVDLGLDNYGVGLELGGLELETDPFARSTPPSSPSPSTSSSPSPPPSTPKPKSPLCSPPSSPPSSQISITLTLDPAPTPTRGHTEPLGGGKFQVTLPSNVQRAQSYTHLDSSSGGGKTRSYAYQKPAFPRARPSLPSLHVLAQMDLPVPNKVRKGRVGATLPAEPWDMEDVPLTPTPSPLVTQFPHALSNSNALSHTQTSNYTPAHPQSTATSAQPAFNLTQPPGNHPHPPSAYVSRYGHSEPRPEVHGQLDATGRDIRVTSEITEDDEVPVPDFSKSQTDLHSEDYDDASESFTLPTARSSLESWDDSTSTSYESDADAFFSSVESTNASSTWTLPLPMPPSVGSGDAQEGHGDAPPTSFSTFRPDETDHYLTSTSTAVKGGNLQCGPTSPCATFAPTSPYGQDQAPSVSSHSASSCDPDELTCTREVQSHELANELLLKRFVSADDAIPPRRLSSAASQLLSRGKSEGHGSASELSGSGSKSGSAVQRVRKRRSRADMARDGTGRGEAKGTGKGEAEGVDFDEGRLDLTWVRSGHGHGSRTRRSAAPVAERVPCSKTWTPPGSPPRSFISFPSSRRASLSSVLPTASSPPFTPSPSSQDCSSSSAPSAPDSTPPTAPDSSTTTDPAPSRTSTLRRLKTSFSQLTIRARRGRHTDADTRPPPPLPSPPPVPALPLPSRAVPRPSNVSGKGLLGSLSLDLELNQPLGLMGGEDGGRSSLGCSPLPPPLPRSALFGDSSGLASASASTASPASMSAASPASMSAASLSSSGSATLGIGSGSPSPHSSASLSPNPNPSTGQKIRARLLSMR